VRISNVALSLRVIPRGYHGWGIFRYCGDHKSVQFVEEPTKRQKRLYLEQFPKTSLIICSHSDSITVGAQLYRDGRFSFDATSILFPENISLFDAVQVRYYNGSFIYEKHDGGFGAYINEAKEAFAAETHPDKLVKMFEPFLIAYKFAYNETIKAKEQTLEQRIKEAIHRAGGTYRGFTDRGNTLTVQFNIAGESFTPTINKHTLRIENAGICLSGTDRAFDLQSFVCVAQEAANNHRIVRGDYLQHYGDRSGSMNR
jgi:hypothetical protein